MENRAERLTEATKQGKVPGKREDTKAHTLRHSPQTRYATENKTMNYRQLQTALKPYKEQGLTTIKLNAKKAELEAEYDRLKQAETQEATTEEIASAAADIQPEPISVPQPQPVPQGWAAVEPMPQPKPIPSGWSVIEPPAPDFTQVQRTRIALYAIATAPVAQPPTALELLGKTAHSIKDAIVQAKRLKNALNPRPAGQLYDYSQHQRWVRTNSALIAA